MRKWLAIWLILITALSLAPYKVKQGVGTTGLLHVPGHFLVFLVTGVLMRLAGGRLVLVYAYCVVLEALQMLVYRHHRFEWEDVLVDCAGIGAAQLLLRWWWPETGPNRRRQPASPDVDENALSR